MQRPTGLNQKEVGGGTGNVKSQTQGKGEGESGSVQGGKKTTERKKIPFASKLRQEREGKKLGQGGPRKENTRSLNS